MIILVLSGAINCIWHPKHSQKRDATGDSPCCFVQMHGYLESTVDWTFVEMDSQRLQQKDSGLFMGVFDMDLGPSTQSTADV